MSLAQIIIIGIGLLIVASSVDFKTLFASLKSKEKEITGYVPTPVTPPAPVQPVVAIDTKNELVLLVQKWQALKDACDKNNLTEASAKLDEIFPVLIKVEKT